MTSRMRVRELSREIFLQGGRVSDAIEMEGKRI